MLRLKKGKLLYILLIALLLFIPFEVEAASWKFIWKNTTVHVPVGSSIESYKNVPRAYLYKNEVMLTDSTITYNTEGDWLYYFKDVNSQRVGIYPVWYKAYDSKYSPGTCTGYKALINFIVEDKDPPKVSIHNPLYKIRRGASYDLSSNYNVTDNYELESVTLSESIDVSKVGTYSAQVIARDTSGNETISSFEVLVYEDSYPVISCDALGDIIEIPVGQDYDIKSHFTATDSFEGDITSKIEFPPITNSGIGSYSYTVSVTNGANLTSSYMVTIKVIDNEPPTLELTTHSIFLDYTEDFDSIDYTKYIKALSDNEEINYNNLRITNNLENKIGSYTIWYSYTDGVFEVTDSIDASVISYDKPEIIVDDIEITIGSELSLYDFIQVYDESDSSVASSLEVYDQNVDYETAGTYYAEAYCINSSGQSDLVTFKVVIVDIEEEASSSNLPFLIGMIVAIVIAVSLVIFLVIYIVLNKRRLAS